MVVGEPALDGARHGAQLCFPIGGNPSLHPRGRQAPARGVDRRIREQPVQPLVGVAGAFARFGIERQQQVAVAGERGQQAQLAVVKEPEAVDDHQGGQRGGVPRGCGRCRQRRRGEPTVVLQGPAIRVVDGGDRRHLRVAGTPGRGRESLRGNILGQQLFDRCPQHRQRGSGTERGEVSGVVGVDQPARDAPEQLAQDADRDGLKPAVEPARHAARGFHLQVERHAARRQQQPPELVAVPDRGHQHQRGRKRIPPVPVRRSPE